MTQIVPVEILYAGACERVPPRPCAELADRLHAIREYELLVLALNLWADQYAAFEALKVASPDELACHHFFLSRDVRVGVGSFFTGTDGDSYHEGPQFGLLESFS